MKDPVGATLTTVTYTDKHGGKHSYRYWKTRIQVEGKNIALGHFKTKREAVEIYQAAKRLRPRGLVHVIGLLDR